MNITRLGFLRIAAWTLAAVAALFAADSLADSDIRSIAYDGSGMDTSRGDLFLPDAVDADTPVVLVIHGGGWSSMCRRDLEGVATFFRDDLGFAAFNIDYRLASATNRWPACGEDCVQAAKYLLSPAFENVAGLAPKKIWICGASAGGHLALWTALSLPPGKVAGVVAISPIGDPLPDFKRHPGRYKALLGDNALAHLADMDPCRLVGGAGPPILLTHATKDPVVPQASSTAFADAYRQAGGDCELYSYEPSAEPNTGGHCIWRPGHKPNKLMAALERRIVSFVRSSRCRKRKGDT